MITLNTQAQSRLTASQWLTLGAIAAILATTAVLVVKWVALSIWPDAALFKPLDNYARTAIFTIIPAFLATALFAWLAGRRDDPTRVFIRISLVVLVISFIPDYILPVPYRTLLAGTIAAFLHVVAAVVIVGALVAGYRRYGKQV